MVWIFDCTNFLILPSTASYASHSQFVPYELLDEGRREELRTFTLDLLRYVKVSGYDITQNRLYGGGMSFVVSLDASFSSEVDPSSEEERKFCLQFFDRFLGYLSLQTLDPNFYLKVLFPVMTSYLKQHRTYFMPSEGQRGHSFASREEKLSITLCVVCNYFMNFGEASDYNYFAWRLVLYFLQC